ncbi:hypothetical protein ABRT01_00180 [Lentibacillus sp. L22]|uniref:hypothetical protein n=1 Tax=Lentibacillus sp. L22 TaxID=3163028 RepID=UPI0034672188
MTERNKITQMDAFLIETIRANGISNQELLEKVKQGNVSEWKNFNPHFDFTRLVDLYQQDTEALSCILNDGYTLKFVTIKGIQRLLRLKFGMEADKDYRHTENGLSGISVTEKQLAVINDMLSPNWTIHVDATSDKINYEISILQTYALN